MTSQDKKDVKTVSISVLILMLFAFGSYLNIIKADRSELSKVEYKTDKNCERIEQNRELMNRVERTLTKVETLLEERTK